ncbi:MAG TPA: transposase [Bryobacteraceae bacterium]|nr:transposase [Bryobacteraceae bacterium]
MESRFCFYVGIDWATQNHEICVIDADGKTIKQKTIEHSGSGIAQLIDWLEQICGGDRKCGLWALRSRMGQLWKA